MSDDDIEKPKGSHPSSRPTPPPSSTTVQLAYHHQASALPPASQMEAYERLMPGATDRLFRILEQDVATTQEQMRDHSRFMLRGQLLSFVTLLGVLGIAAFVAYQGAPAAAATLVGVSVGGGALMNLFARRRRP
jgi:uncharacterized membrane protein